jgi:hypothetical protein
MVYAPIAFWQVAWHQEFEQGGTMITFNTRGRPGSYRIVESGSFSLPGDAVAFSIPLNDLQFNLRFERGGGGTPRIDIVSSEEKSVRLSLVNFDNPLGVSFESPVGIFEDKQIELSLIVRSVKSIEQEFKPRTITYSFFQRYA